MVTSAVSRMASSSRRRVLAAVAAVAGGYGLYRAARSGDDDEFDPYNMGVCRFGRAAATVISIGVDYKRTLYSEHGMAAAGEELDSLKSACHSRSAAKLLKLCCNNGGCFIKVGQHIGALDYLLPEEYVQTMKVLHSRAPEMDLRHVYSVLREEFQKEPEDVFETFDERPLGTASLAQVHRATLRESGEEVAVKVQHRYVKKHSFVDIYTMDFLVKSVKFFFPQFEFMWLAEEMKKNLPLELSFTQEGRNAERISLLMEDFRWLKIPEIHWDLTTDRVLTMEYCPGGHVNDLDYLRRHGIDPYEVSRKMGSMYADMIFKFGYVHCDPHPGNVLVRRAASGGGHPEIVLLDHGLYTQLTFDFRQKYANFWLSILNADVDGIRTYADQLGVGALSGLFACMVAGRSWSSIQRGIGKQRKNAEESKEIKSNAQRYIRQIADVLALVNRQMILIFKTNDLLRAIEHSLGTGHSMGSFIQMSRACFRCLNRRRYRQCDTALCRLRVSLASRWDQVKLSFYQVFLWLWWSRVGRWCVGALTG